MRTVARVFSLIAGIIATIIGLVSIIGVVTSIIFGGFDTFLIKPIIMCVLFFVCAISFLCKNRGVYKLIMLFFMIIVLILEQFIWVGSIFLFTEAAISLVSIEVALIFAQYYSIVMYVILACSFIALIFHIIGMALKK